MTPAADWLEDPPALCTFLRGRGLRLGTGEVLRVSAVLVELARRSQTPRTPEEANIWLSPLVCTSAAQQALLPRMLSEYASLHTPIDTPPPPPPVLPAPEPPPEAWLIQILKRPLVVGTIALVALGVFLAIGAVQGSKLNTTPPHGSETAIGPTLSLPEWDWSRLILGLQFAIIPLAFWLFFYQWYRRRPLVLQRARSREEPEKKRQLPDDPESSLTLFGALDLRRPLQAMRAHRAAPSSSYDFRQSVVATAKAGGYLTLVPERRPALPEYPLIIEQLSGKDHVAALGRALAERLTAERVAATAYTFSTDIRVLRGDPRRLLGLGDLLNRHGDETVILVSDGDALIDPLTETASSSVAELLAWSNPVLLTPIPLQRWSRRERTLAEAGLLVLPATPEGLEQLSQKLAGNVELQSPALHLRAGRLSNIRREADDHLAWHHDEPMPSPDEREQILATITSELSAAAFELLCVLALFPEVRLDLTLHMGTRLKRRNGKPLLDEESFGALAWLPWMRLGRLPDWLRLDLIHCLSVQRREEAVKLYERWLAPELAGKGGEVLAIAQEKSAFARLLRRHVASDRTTPLRDVIFLKSQRGETVSDLDLRAPDTLRRLLRPGWFELEWVAGAAALLLAAVAFVFAPELARLLESFAVNESIVLAPTLLIPPLSIVAWHVAAYWTRSRTWLSAVSVLLLLSTLVFHAMLIIKETGIFVISVFGLPAFALALALPTTGVTERPQPQRPLPVSAFALLAVAYIAIMAAIASSNEVQGWTAAACGLLVIAFLTARMTGLPYVPIAIGSVFGAIFSLYPVALPAIIIKAVTSAIISEFLLVSALAQVGFVAALYGGLMAALLLGRIRLTRFLIIAAASVLAILAAVIAEGLLRSFGVKKDQAVAVWSSYFPFCSLCLILTCIALVRPDAMRSRALIRGCLLFAVGITLIDYLAGMITLPFPNLGESLHNGRLVLNGVPIGAAVQFLFVPGAIAAILADLADADQRRGETALLSPWRSLVAVYIPPAWLLTVPLLWLLTIRGPLFGASLEAPLLFIPAAAALGAVYGPASLPAVVFGGLPFLARMPVGSGPIELIGDPGIFLCGILMHRLFAEPQFRTRCFFANSIKPMQSIALVVLLAGTYQLSLNFLGPSITIGGSFRLAFFYVMFIVGASRIAIAPVVSVIIAAGLVGVVLNLVPPFELPIGYVSFGLSEVRETTTAITFLLLGRICFHQQLPSLLIPAKSKDRATNRNMIIGIVALVALLTHVGVKYDLLERNITDGLIGAAVLQPLIFLLGFSFGARGVLYGGIALLFGELLSGAAFGTGMVPRTAPLFGGTFQLTMNFDQPLNVVLSRLDEMMFGFFGWLVMLAFRPDLRVRRVNASGRPEAPLAEAA